MSSKSIAGVAAALVVAAFLAAPRFAAQDTRSTHTAPRQGPSAGASAVSAQDPPRERVYVVLYARGPGFVEEAGTAQPGIEEHVEFIMKLHAAGVVPLGGPLFDDDQRKQVSGILYFVKAGSAHEAREIAQREPMVKTRVVEIVSVREFLTGVGAGRLD